MPAQTVAGAPAPQVAKMHAAAGEPHTGGVTDGHFGRQLDAARQEQPHKGVVHEAADRAGAQRGVGAQPATAVSAEAAAEVVTVAPGFAEVVKGVLGEAGTAAGKVSDEADRASTDSVPQGAFALFVPLLGGVSLAPAAVGGVDGRGRAVGQVIDAVDAARTAALLQMPAAGAQPAAAASAGLALNPVSLSVVLDAVQSPAADEVHGSATTPAGISSTLLPPLPPLSAGVPVVTVTTPVGTPAFGQDFGRQIPWLATQDLKQARIRLHPDELGQVDLKITLDHGRVDVVFSVQHPGAAQAVQQSLPQLDQMLAQHGLSLGHTEVGQHGSDGSDGSSSQHHGAGTAAGDAIGELHSVTSTIPVRPSSLLDAFA